MNFEIVWDLGIYIIPAIFSISILIYYWNTFGFELEKEMYNRIEYLKYVSDMERKETEKKFIIEQIDYCEVSGHITSKVRKEMLETLSLI